MLRRLSNWAWQLLLALDQLAHVAIVFFTFVLLNRGKRPNADETISSRVGRNAASGKPWAIAHAKVIDWLAWKLVGEKDHCANAIERFDR